MMAQEDARKAKAPYHELKRLELLAYAAQEALFQ